MSHAYIQTVKTYLLALQEQICAVLEQVDGEATFQEDNWQRGNAPEKSPV